MVFLYVLGEEVEEAHGGLGVCFKIYNFGEKKGKVKGEGLGGWVKFGENGEDEGYVLEVGVIFRKLNISKCKCKTKYVSFRAERSVVSTLYKGYFKFNQICENEQDLTK